MNVTQYLETDICIGQKRENKRLKHHGDCLNETVGRTRAATVAQTDQKYTKLKTEMTKFPQGSSTMTLIRLMAVYDSQYCLIGET